MNKSQKLIEDIEKAESPPNPFIGPIVASDSIKGYAEALNKDDPVETWEWKVKLMANDKVLEFSEEALHAIRNILGKISGNIYAIRDEALGVKDAVTSAEEI